MIISDDKDTQNFFREILYKNKIDTNYKYVWARLITNNKYLIQVDAMKDNSTFYEVLLSKPSIHDGNKFIFDKTTDSKVLLANGAFAFNNFEYFQIKNGKLHDDFLPAFMGYGKSHKIYYWHGIEVDILEFKAKQYDKYKNTKLASIIMGEILGNKNE